MLKPYFVELTVTDVVMAESPLQAHLVAEEHASAIIRDTELSADSAVLVESLEHLARLEPEWEGGCVPYGGDGNTRLSALLPAAAQAKDARTIDMFATTN